MARRRKSLLWILTAGALAALAVFGLRSGGSPSVGRRAPSLPRERLAGMPVSLASLTAGAGGRSVVIIFWASWCGPCLREAPALERFSRSAAGSGRIVGVDWSDSLAGAKSFIRHYSWTFSNVRDSEGTVGNEYHLTGLPTSFVLDGSGHIRAELRGPQDEGSLSRALARVPRT
jgi:thiol-disulfide isomerase/thioredoxin